MFRLTRGKDSITKDVAYLQLCNVLFTEEIAVGYSFRKEYVGERLHHADVRRYTFQRSVGEHLSSFSV